MSSDGPSAAAPSPPSRPVMWLLTDLPFALLAVIGLGVGALFLVGLMSDLTTALGAPQVPLEMIPRGFGWPFRFWFPTGPFGGPDRSDGLALVADLLLVLAVLAGVRRWTRSHPRRLWRYAAATLALSLVVVEGGRHLARLPEARRRAELSTQRLAALCLADGAPPCTAADWALWSTDLHRYAIRGHKAVRATGRAAALDVTADGFVNNDDARMLARHTRHPHPEDWADDFPLDE